MNQILTVNTGSSSIKTALFHVAETEQLHMKGEIKNIGQPEGQLIVTNGCKEVLFNEKRPFSNHKDALKTFMDRMQTQQINTIDAVGHRLVHGGKHYLEPQRISEDVLAKLDRAIPFDPLHLPVELEGVRIIREMFPALPQVACFDTAFHRRLPTAAKMFPLPRRFFEEGIYRYGFHGLSYEFILSALSAIAGEVEANGKIIIAHLGSGASMAAIKEGRCLDTTMGLTSSGGLVMSTRSGDVDPGLLIFLMTERGLTGDALRQLINRESGILGISGVSADMKELLSKEESDSNAALAIEIFCLQASKFIGAFSSVLSGLHTLIFTGGIGENSPPIRQRICAKLKHLGLNLDEINNEKNHPVISNKESVVTVRVMQTNEELMIARHTHRVACSERSPR
ncbi:MAG: acetate/propionate family kinase [Waddliaceae bacterium]